MDRRGLLIGSLVATSYAWSRALASYPDRPVRVIVPFAPGGNADLMARLAAPIMSGSLQQPIVIENRGGAGGSTGTEQVVRARPDGYSLLWASNGPLVNSPLMSREPRYDALRDLTAVGLMSLVPMVIAVRTSLPVRNLAELIEYARAHGSAGVSIGTSGVGGGNHVPLELFKAATRGNLVHVPYRGSGAALPDLVFGTLDGMLTEFSSVLDLHRDGRARIIGIAAPQRSPLVPEVQTFIEFGLADFTAATFNGLWAPTGTPPPVVDRLQEALGVAVDTPSVIEAVVSRGAEPATAIQRTPAGATTFLETEIARMRQAMVLADIQPE